jgi:hypothetical protein
MRDPDAASDANNSGTADRALRLAGIAAYSFALLIALRFGGRTYPGWYFPDSALLNSWLNGVGLFTEVGYDLVLVVAAAATMRLLPGGRTSLALRLMHWTALALVILIILYGVDWAIYTHRLPWQADGHGRYTPFLSMIAEDI